MAEFMTEYYLVIYMVRLKVQIRLKHEINPDIACYRVELQGLSRKIFNVWIIRLFKIIKSVNRHSWFIWNDNSMFWSCWENNFDFFFVGQCSCSIICDANRSALHTLHEYSLSLDFIVFQQKQLMLCFRWMVVVIIYSTGELHWCVEFPANWNEICYSFICFSLARSHWPIRYVKW